MAGRLIFAIALMPMLAGCATSFRTLTGVPRPALSPTEVKVYTQAPQSFEEIAVLGASRKSVTSAGGERAIEKMIEAMKSQAAELGANGVLLENLSDSDPLSLGTGVGTQTYTHNASIDLGVGGFLGVVKKTVRARAIFVAAHSDMRPADNQRPEQERSGDGSAAQDN
jgi:hypothetical protein